MIKVKYETVWFKLVDKEATVVGKVVSSRLQEGKGDGR